MYQLVYSRLIPNDGGTYELRDKTYWGDPWNGASVGDWLTTYSDLIDGFLCYLTDPFGADCAAAADVTLAEGWLGWGTVVRATAQNGDWELYCLQVEEYEKEEQRDGHDIDSGSGGAAGDNG